MMSRRLGWLAPLLCMFLASLSGMLLDLADALCRFSRHAGGCFINRLIGRVLARL